MAMGKKKSTIGKVFTVAEDSRFAKCDKCNVQVPGGGQSTKTFTPMNSVVHHLKTKPGDEEEYERYNTIS